MTTESTRHNQKWTELEDNQLLNLQENNKTFKQISILMNRTQDAVQARFVKIYLCPMYNSKYLCKKAKDLAHSYNINIDDFIRYLKYAGIKYKQNNTVARNQNKYDTDTEYVITTIENSVVEPEKCYLCNIKEILNYVKKIDDRLNKISR